MKNLVTTLLMVLVCTLFGHTQVKVSYDYDKEADFSKYNSYSYTKEALELPLNDLNRKRLLQSISDEMSEKGFSKSENGDLLLDVKIKAELKQSATATTDWYGTGYRYRWGPSFTTTRIDVNEYLEGTIFIDMIDRNTKQMVWQGRGIGTIHPEVKTEKREKRIKKATAKIFSQYPPGK